MAMDSRRWHAGARVPLLRGSMGLCLAHGTWVLLTSTRYLGVSAIGPDEGTRVGALVGSAD